ncbi:MAG: N-acetylmuramoyl-L-alanine amidase [Clostridia bacterium]|nr:N-acetylmuramoyl-L-alanine amidase [Clostridia bacterium]
MINLLTKQKVLVCFLLVIVLVTSFYSGVVAFRTSKSNGITIVIDAGHGGRDGGSVGINGTIEKEINLDYAFALKDKLVENGYKVVLTRHNDDGLYSEFAKNKKQSDMLERFKIIEKANPNLVISIHMNSFSSPSAFGATTYYRKDDMASKRCADLIQKSIKSSCETKFEYGKVGDFYMLNCSYYTAVLIECGFISNPDEERLLNNDNYKKQMINAIYNGIFLYLGNSQA